MAGRRIRGSCGLKTHQPMEGRALTANKRDQPVQDHFLLTLGQLIEATKASNEGLRINSAECRANAAAVLTVGTQTAQLEKSTYELDRIIRDVANPHNLVAVDAAQEREIRDLKRELEALHQVVDRLQGSDARRTSTWTVVWHIMVAIGWVGTFIVGLYTALGTWYGGKKP